MEDQNLIVVPVVAVVVVVVVVLANFEVASIEVVLEAYQAFLALQWRSLQSSLTDPTLSKKQDMFSRVTKAKHSKLGIMIWFRKLNMFLTCKLCLIC